MASKRDASQTPDRASRLMPRPREADARKQPTDVSEKRPFPSGRKPLRIKAGRRFTLFRGLQGLSVPQTLTNGFQRGENVAILQQGGTIERCLLCEKADPDCAACALA